MQNHSATTAILIEKRKPHKDGKFPIKLRVTYQRKQNYYTFRDEDGNRMAYTENEYSKIKCERPRGEFKDISIYLKGVEKKAMDVIKQLNIFSFPAFEDRFFDSYGDKENIFAALEKGNKTLKEEGRISTARSYECTLNSLKKYTKKNELSFINIDVNFLNEYEKWMLKENNSETTIGIYLRNVRTMFNDAIRNGVIKMEQYPFGRSKYQIPGGRNIKKAINLNDIGLIAKYKVTEGTNEHRFRDYWLFSYLSNGINVKDIARLKYSNIDGELISFYRAKTKRGLKQNPKLISIVITDVIDRIIDKWGNKPKTPDNFIFPILEPGLTPQQEYGRIQQINKLIRKYIDRISKKVGITQKVTNMVARHSFASTLKRSGASIEFISESLGHKNLRTTQNYLADFEIKEKRKWAEQVAKGVEI